jgi:hypothetical protein
LYATLAAVLAGFSVALVGLLAQYLVTEEKDAARRGDVVLSLGVLLPGVLASVIAAYLYAEAGGATDTATQLFVTLVAAEALAAGALATFASFVPLVHAHDGVLVVTVRWVYWSVAVITTVLVGLGNWTMYRGLWSTGLSFGIWVESLIMLVGLGAAVVVSRREKLRRRGQSALARAGAGMAAVFALGGVSVIIALSSECANSNLSTARHIQHFVGIGRALLWCLVLVMLALAVGAPPKSAPPKPRPLEAPRQS